MSGILELGRCATIRTPPGNQPGYWAGAPGVFYDPAEPALYLTYRLRRPRGVPPDRGGEARIARSTDFRNFEDLWSVTKDAFRTASIERSALHRGPEGAWHYFTSFVDPEDGRWCVAELMADRVEELDPRTTRRVFTAGPLGLEGIKDPWILEENGVYRMILSVALPTSATTPAAHETLDIYNTGQCLSATGMAVSRDLRHWEWEGIILAPEGTGWDRYCRRINSLLRHDGQWLAFYDGSAGHTENYEEKTGLAQSGNLREWTVLTPEQPWLTSPEGSGSLRYLDAVRLEGRLRLFYEQARADGAHELRLAELEEAQAAGLFGGRR